MPGGKRHALGQHFLRDAGIARAIVDLVAPTPADLAVEIGAGQGALTGELARRAAPKVESAVLRLRPLPAPRVDLEDEQRFEAVVRAAFAQRRKTLANALAAGLGLSVGATREAATSAGVDPGRRAETLNIQEFAEVARRL